MSYKLRACGLGIEDTGNKDFGLNGTNHFLSETREGVLLHIKVFPNAAKSEIGDLHGDFLRIRIASAPVKGRANKECLKLLATFFKVKKSQVIFKKGESSRLKMILLKDITLNDVLERLKEKHG